MVASVVSVVNVGYSGRYHIDHAGLAQERIACRCCWDAGRVFTGDLTDPRIGRR